MALDHQLHRLAGGRQRRVVKFALRKHRREPGGGQQDVALAQRHLELLGQVQHHLATGLRAAGFQKAQMPRGDVALQCQVELADVPPLAPFAQQWAELGCGA